MEDTNWSQRLQTLTYIIINPTTTPPLHSQFFVSSQIPCYIRWDYPPILCTKADLGFPPIDLRWAFSVFLKRVWRFGLPETSWRSKCPYQVPPPLILAKGVEEAQWSEEQKRAYAKKRFRRKLGGIDINPLIPILVPNMLLFTLLLWNPVLD